MSEREPESEDSRKALGELWPHAAISLVYLIAMALVWLNTMPYSVEANEVGDFMSGMFAPLAFYWLILGYYLQREELGLQRRELRLNREQLEVQSDELKRQADAYNEMIGIQERTALRQQIDDKITSVPHQVLKLLSCYRPFSQLGKSTLTDQYMETFLRDIPEEPVPSDLKFFIDYLVTRTHVWSSTFEDQYGILSECMRERDPEAFQRLEDQYRRLSDWWEGCRTLTILTGMDSLAAKGDECGIEALLSATARASNIVIARSDATLARITGSATATVE